MSLLTVDELDNMALVVQSETDAVKRRLNTTCDIRRLVVVFQSEVWPIGYYYPALSHKSDSEALMKVK